MLSVPPAIMACPEPALMRSAANAMACKPDAQNRLTVTADASTGMPARRLAIRATFMPCSASGMAHPRMTSSISLGSMPGARFSASPIAAAPSSSGRVPRSVPPGALPTAVRAAETITASTIPIPQQILDRLGDLGHLAVEQVIGALDDGKLLGFGGAPVERAHLAEPADLVEFPVDEELRLGALLHAEVVVPGHRQRDADKRRHAR